MATWVATDIYIKLRIRANKGRRVHAYPAMSRSIAIGRATIEGERFWWSMMLEASFSIELQVMRMFGTINYKRPGDH